MTYTLATHFPTQNYTLLHTGLSNHLHTFTHSPLGVCKVCKCVVWVLCVVGKKMLFRIEDHHGLHPVEHLPQQHASGGGRKLAGLDLPTIIPNDLKLPAWRAKQCKN